MATNQLHKTKVEVIMRAINARLLSEGRYNDTELQFWQVGIEVCIVQYFENNTGCMHYVQGDGTTWVEMESQLKAIAGVDHG